MLGITNNCLIGIKASSIRRDLCLGLQIQSVSCIWKGHRPKRKTHYCYFFLNQSNLYLYSKNLSLQLHVNTALDTHQRRFFLYQMETRIWIHCSNTENKWLRDANPRWYNCRITLYLRLRDHHGQVIRYILRTTGPRYLVGNTVLQT